MSATGAALCCCSCCCADLGETCRRLIGPQKITKFNYFLLVFGFVVPVMLVVVLFNFLQSWLSLSPTQLLTRLSFALLVLFLLMFLIMLCHNSCAMILNEGIFGIKYLLVAVLFITSFFLPNDIFVTYF